jgi:hypothetical protein
MHHISRIGGRIKKPNQSEHAYVGVRVLFLVLELPMKIDEEVGLIVLKLAVCECNYHAFV